MHLSSNNLIYSLQILLAASLASKVVVVAEDLPTLTDYGWDPQVLLQLCEGDCDLDSDCADGLKCFQRDDFTPVPGCAGTGKYQYDYCILESTPSPTISPTRSSTGAPSVSPTMAVATLTFYGSDPQFPLKLCEGDCDFDSDCVDGLKCFQRDDDTPVPGCAGTGLTSWDYCYRPRQTLFAGDKIYPGNALWDENLAYKFELQLDGNMVLYCPGNKPGWASDTVGDSAGYAIFQDDGNFVVYTDSGQALWDSGTRGNPGSRLVLQTDGNLVIYNSQDNALWATNTYGCTFLPPTVSPTISPTAVPILKDYGFHPQFLPLQLCEGDCDLDSDCVDGLKCFQRINDISVPGCAGTGIWGADYCIRPPRQTLFPGDTLKLGDSLWAENFAYKFELQLDGNMVLYCSGNKVGWASDTDGSPAEYAIFQDDGNFVLYTNGGQALWDSGTSGNPGSRLVLQNDGNLVIYNSQNNALWATNTLGCE